MNGIYLNRMGQIWSLFILTSIFLTSDSRKACPIDILGSCWEHFAMYPQICNWLEFACASPHSLSGVSLAHSGSFVPTLSLINPTCSIIAPSPAVLNWRVVTMLMSNLTKWRSPCTQHSKVLLHTCCSKYPELTFNIIDINVYARNIKISSLSISQPAQIPHRRHKWPKWHWVNWAHLAAILSNEVMELMVGKAW